MKISEVLRATQSPEYVKYLQLEGISQELSVLESQFKPEDYQIFSKLEQLTVKKQEKTQLEGAIALLQSSLNQVEAQYKKAVKDQTNNKCLTEFYKVSLETLTQQYLEQLSDTLTEVYQTVYHSTQKRVLLTMEDYRNKKVVRLNLINYYNKKDYKEELSTDGGSAKIILGTLVAIYFIVSTGMPRIMMFDESFSALATETLHEFLNILQKFSEELGFVFVVVAHDIYRFKNHVTQMYTIKDGVYEEVESDKFDSHFEESRGE